MTEDVSMTEMILKTDPEDGEMTEDPRETGPGQVRGRRETGPCLDLDIAETDPCPLETVGDTEDRCCCVLMYFSDSSSQVYFSIRGK